MNYDVCITKNDPVLTVAMPADILRSITLRSLENGTSVELEISTRLARTLERDLEMENEDEILLDKAYASICK